MSQSEQIEIGFGTPNMFDEIATLYNLADGIDNPDHVDLDGDYFQDSYSRLGLSLEKDVITARTLDHKLVGLILMNIRREPEIAAYVSMFVHPKYRRRGIGTRLLTECEKHARSRGTVSLECNIPTFRPETIAFAKKRGFRKALTWLKFANYNIDKIKKPFWPDGFEIRPIQKDEADIWAKLQNDLFRERPLYKPVTGDDFLRFASSESFVEDLCIFGFYNGRLIGYCINQVIRPVAETQKRLFPQGLGVIPEFRGRGFGRILFEEVHWRAARLGIRISEFVVEESNRIGISLYTSVGFKPRYKRDWYVKKIAD